MPRLDMIKDCAPNARIRYLDQQQLVLLGSSWTIHGSLLAHTQERGSGLGSDLSCRLGPWLGAQRRGRDCLPTTSAVRASSLVLLIAAGGGDITANMLIPRGLVCVLCVSRSFLQDPLSTRDSPKLRLPWHYIYSNGSQMSGC